MTRLRRLLKPGGVFGLWSNEQPDEGFLAILASVFDRVRGHTVEFANPVQGGTAVNGVYVAKVPHTLSVSSSGSEQLDQA